MKDIDSTNINRNKNKQQSGERERLRERVRERGRERVTRPLKVQRSDWGLVITGRFDHLTLRRHAYHRNCKWPMVKLGTYKSSLKSWQRQFFSLQNTTKRKHTEMSFTQRENPSLNMRRCFTSNEETSVLWLVFRNLQVFLLLKNWLFFYLLFIFHQLFYKLKLLSTKCSFFLHWKKLIICMQWQLFLKWRFKVKCIRTASYFTLRWAEFAPH